MMNVVSLVLFLRFAGTVTLVAGAPNNTNQYTAMVTPAGGYPAGPTGNLSFNLNYGLRVTSRPTLPYGDTGFFAGSSPSFECMLGSGWNTTAPPANPAANSSAVNVTLQMAGPYTFQLTVLDACYANVRACCAFYFVFCMLMSSSSLAVVMRMCPFACIRLRVCVAECLGELECLFHLPYCRQCEEYHHKLHIQRLRLDEPRFPRHHNG